MRKRIAILSIFGIALVLLLASCATGGTKGKVVSSYELAGITLKAGYDVARPACDQGLIAPEKCIEIKEIYNEARSAYLLAGDLLITAIETEDLLKRQATLQEYQDLAELYTMNTTALFNLLVELGAMKKE